MPNDPVNIFEYEAIAREKLEQGHYDFIAGAATDEITLGAPAPSSTASTCARRC